MSLKLIAVGGLKKRWIRLGCDQYLERIKHHVPINVIEVREAGGNDSSDRIMGREAERLLARLDARDWPVALDIRGKPYDSEEFAAWLNNRLADGRFHTTFLIGGALGLSRAVLTACRESISLSPMTMPHELCRVLLLEQLYRATTIIRGEPYHK